MLRIEGGRKHIWTITVSHKPARHTISNVPNNWEYTGIIEQTPINGHID